MQKWYISGVREGVNGNIPYQEGGGGYQCLSTYVCKVIIAELKHAVEKETES